MAALADSLPDDIATTVRRALDEDIGSGDLTASLLEPEARAQARVVVREPAVLAGRPWFDEVFAQIDPAVRVEWLHADGEQMAENDIVCRLTGPARAILTGERTALNFLQTLSAVATIARHYSDAVAGTGCRILDTRKTLPGLRSAQKYAVRAGGATNHRMGLFDAVLIKENHIIAAGGVDAAIAAVRARHPDVPVEVEVEDFEQLDAALAAGADRVLLDNFSLEQKREAVKKTAGRAELEASGGIEFDGLRAIAETGVDFISVGALTKHVRAIDLSMRFTLE
ncbi:MAG TPA: carboxylating nicotinate-nucleotide diphosphorylase [Gammaproteobacteria bacterium]|nr:carboxylating nicotinate-nucleotide diphosphorylase [Gammaproteobacteria bacterium]